MWHKQNKTSQKQYRSVHTKHNRAQSIQLFRNHDLHPQHIEHFTIKPGQNAEQKPTSHTQSPPASSSNPNKHATLQTTAIPFFNTCTTLPTTSPPTPQPRYTINPTTLTICTHNHRAARPPFTD
jgi:hypothetical protein